LKKVTEQEVLCFKSEFRGTKTYEDVAVATSLLRNEVKSGSIVSREAIKNGTKTLVLSNGVKVTYKNTDFKTMKFF
jgi:zinc protease